MRAFTSTNATSSRAKVLVRKSKLLFAATADGGIVERVCEGSALYCARLEKRALVEGGSAGSGIQSPPLTSPSTEVRVGQQDISPDDPRGTRSAWRNTVSDPKTAKSKAPVPVIPQLAQRLDEHRVKCGKRVAGPIFANSVGHPLDLNSCYQREMKDVLKRAGIVWHGWHGFRRGLASNLNRLGVDDSVIQRILRHSTVAATQNHYIKTASPDAIAAMKQFSEALLCSRWGHQG
jgi:Phage integrase family